MNEPLYTTQVLRLAASLEGPRQLEREDGRAELRSPTCGARIETAVQLDHRGGVIAISQRVHACAFGQAAAALVEKEAVGHRREELETARAQVGDWLAGSEQIPDWPGMTALAPARSKPSRHGAILLPFRALLAAMEGAASKHRSS